LEIIIIWCIILSEATGKVMTGISGLEKLVRSISFKRETVLPHILPGIMLIVSLPAYASILYHVLLGGLSAAQQYWYSSLTALYIGYVLSASYSAYRLTQITTKHLVDSGITSYYWLKRIDDIESIIKLYQGGLLRRNMPSPITSLLITLFTGGLAYPIVLYIIDRSLRNHCYGEEGKFLDKHYTGRIGIEHGLVFIAATILTIGFFLIIWDYLVVKTYNKHLELIHGKHPEPPTTSITPIDVTGYEARELPILVIMFAFLGAGIYGLLGILGFPAYLPLIIGYGLLLGGVSAYYRYSNFTAQAIRVYGLIYLLFILVTIVGYSSAPTYYRIYENIGKQISSLRTHNLVLLLRNIFVNNLAISTISISPYIGPLYLGIGLGNSALFYGVALNIALSHGNYGLLLLPVMPHSIFELLAYALFVSISTRIAWENTRRIIEYILLSIGVLLFAAFIESLTVVASM
jgi:hypothetical protein